MKNIAIIDNYDSFTFNLVQYIEEETNQNIEVIRNDEKPVSYFEKFDTIVLSPGPGLPSDAGVMPEVIKKYATTHHILGICLGHQAIGEAFGASLSNLKQVMHGVKTPILITETNDPIFRDLDQEIEVGRYHSWVIDADSVPADLLVTATDENGFVMAIRHRQYPIFGLQFHPESVLTATGKKMIANFLNI